MVYFREQERVRERAHEHAHARETTHKPKRIPGSCTCPATARGRYNRSMGPSVRIDSLVLAWSHGYQHHLTDSKLKARQKKLREAELHVLHACTLSHTLSSRLSEVPARSVQEVLPSNM